MITTPGSGFGRHGEGYVRFALTQTVETTKQLVARLQLLKKVITGYYDSRSFSPYEIIRMVKLDIFN